MLGKGRNNNPRIPICHTKKVITRIVRVTVPIQRFGDARTWSEVEQEELEARGGRGRARGRGREYRGREYRGRGDRGGQNRQNIPEDPDPPGLPRPDPASPHRPAQPPSPAHPPIQGDRGPNTTPPDNPSPPRQEVIEHGTPPAVAQYPPGNRNGQTSPGLDQSGNDLLLSPEGQRGAQELQQAYNPTMELNPGDDRGLGNQPQNPEVQGAQALQPAPATLHEDVVAGDQLSPPHANGAHGTPERNLQGPQMQGTAPAQLSPPLQPIRPLAPPAENTSPCCAIQGALLPPEKLLDDSRRSLDDSDVLGRPRTTPGELGRLGRAWTTQGDSWMTQGDSWTTPGRSRGEY